MIRDPRTAAVIAIGDELIEGRTVDTNSGAIARRLSDFGIEVVEFRTVGDDRGRLARAFYELTAKYAMVFATGGLGPTLDDVTREAAADAAGVALERNESVVDELKAWFAARKRDFPASNVRQADFPIGAQIMPNRAGTAPGFRVWIDGGVLAVMPGPPREMLEMLERELVPWIESTCGRGEAFARANFYLTGLAESSFADLVGAWMDRGADPRMGVTAHHGVLSVSLRARAGTREAAERSIEARSREFRERFAEWIFSESESRLHFAVAAELARQRLTLALAESCTGGLVTSMLCEVPGISAVLLEGLVCYSNESKVARLGVEHATLERHGAVSSEVAAAMALGLARSTGARVAVSITGIAGPDGGSSEKPVGLVWFGVALDGRVETFESRFPPVGRDAVRRFAAHRALDLVRRHFPRAHS